MTPQIVTCPVCHRLVTEARWFTAGTERTREQFEADLAAEFYRLNRRAYIDPSLTFESPTTDEPPADHDSTVDRWRRFRRAAGQLLRDTAALPANALSGLASAVSGAAELERTTLHGRMLGLTEQQIQNRLALLAHGYDGERVRTMMTEAAMGTCPLCGCSVDQPAPSCSDIWHRQ